MSELPAGVYLCDRRTHKELRVEIDLLKDENDRLREVYIAAKDIRDLRLMSKPCRIDVNQFKAAEESLELTLKDCEKYYEICKV